MLQWFCENVIITLPQHHRHQVKKCTNIDLEIPTNVKGLWLKYIYSFPLGPSKRNSHFEVEENDVKISEITYSSWWYEPQTVEESQDAGCVVALPEARSTINNRSKAVASEEEGFLLTCPVLIRIQLLFMWSFALLQMCLFLVRLHCEGSGALPCI